MTMTSFSFFVFIGVLLIFYYTLPKKCQPFLLILASVIFAAIQVGKGDFVPLVLNYNNLVGSSPVGVGRKAAPKKTNFSKYFSS